MADDVTVSLRTRGRQEFSRDFRSSAGDVERFGRTVDRTGDRMARDWDRSTKRMSRGWGKQLAVMGAAAAAFVAYRGVTALRDFLGEGFAGLASEQKALAQVTAGLKSTGGAANVSKRELQARAEAMEANLGIDADMVLSTQALLLTFTNIRNEVGKGNKIFDRANMAVANLSTRMDGDMKGAAIQVGKSLNDPIKGITALGRAGIQFTDEQKDQIKTLVESGNTMDAQKIILRELTTQFGGSARAFSNTLPGMQAKAGFAFDRIKDAAAGALLPVAEQWLPKLTRAFNSAADWVESHSEDIARFTRRGLRTVVRWVRDEAWPALQDFGDWLSTDGKTIASDLGEMWTAGGDALRPLVRRVWPKAVELVGWLADNAERLTPWLKRAVDHYLLWKGATIATTAIQGAATAMNALSVSMVGASGAAAVGARGGLFAAASKLYKPLAAILAIWQASEFVYGEAQRQAAESPYIPPSTSLGDPNFVPPGGKPAAKPHQPGVRPEHLRMAMVQVRGGDGAAAPVNVGGVSVDARGYTGDPDVLAGKVGAQVGKKVAAVVARR